MSIKPKKKRRIQKTGSDKVMDIVVYTIAILMIVVMAYPIYFVIIASISNPDAVSAGKVLLRPVDINFKAYEKLLNYDEIWIGYRNTIIYTIGATIVGLCVNIPAAYALSRKDLAGKKAMTVFYLIPMFFTGGLIPTYLVVKSVGLLNTPAVMILPFSVVTYFIIVARTFFVNTIPEELWEAAQISGCGTIRFFFYIVLPLSKAVIAVIALWIAVGQWNSYFNALIYLRDANLQPLQIILRNILINNQTVSTMLTGQAATEARKMSDLIKYAVIVISSAPIMCMYPLVQKYFNQGVMLGSVKG